MKNSLKTGNKLKVKKAIQNKLKVKKKDKNYNTPM